jgi:hypothetical protein
MAKYHSDGHMIKQDWLDRLTFKEIQNAIKKEKQSFSQNSKFFFMTIEFAQIKCEDTKYKVLYYEEVYFSKILLFIKLILKKYIFSNRMLKKLCKPYQQMIFL